MANPLQPIGIIEYHPDPDDAFGVRSLVPMIKTDLGWRLANGCFYNRQVYPRLWETLRDRRRGDEVQVPDLMSGKVELGATYRTPRPNPISAHVHKIAPLHTLRDNAKFDHTLLEQQIWRSAQVERNAVIGHINAITSDTNGLSVKMQLNDHFTREIQKGMVDTANLEDLFPEMYGIKGMKWGARSTSTSIKENSMTVKLKTPSETIERKDLTVALELMNTNDRDHLLNAIALVQELGDDETLHRVRDHKNDGVSFVDSYLRVPGTSLAGRCTDVKGGEYSDEPVQFVIDGKLHKLKGLDYVIVKLEEPEPIGNDTLALVRD